MQKMIFSFFIAAIFGCNPKAEKKLLPGSTLPTNSEAQILHSIVVHEEGGLQISRAFLSYENGSFINNRNTVRPGEVVCLNLIVKQGWMAEGDSVAIGATQKISTENGQLVLSSPDLFGSKGKLHKAAAAHLILKTTLVKSNSDAHRFLVRYRVWDKMGTGEATGGYWLVLADASK